jgi:tRNA nucleotidyltransferase (CCA-adding enzyme)
MSDYMFMLESHLSGDQNRVLAAVLNAATQLNANVFLTGGAMRDMMGGFPIRDLDFTVEGPALKMARLVAEAAGGKVVSEDETRKSAELLFPGPVTVQISMARREQRSRPGARPQIVPAVIQEDLRGRDFTVNAIALSLGRASRGLLIDPANGLGDLTRRELRAVHNSIFYDDPSRLLRLVRLRARLGFTIEERTETQYRNAREAKLESNIPPRVLWEQLRQIAAEPNPPELLKALEQEQLLTLFSPALQQGKVHGGGLARLEKARQLIPFGVDLRFDPTNLFLYFLTEKLTPKEKSDLARMTAMEKEEIEGWQKLEARTRKLEAALRAKEAQKPSQVYRALAAAPGEAILFLYLHSKERNVQDRIRNYLQKYLPASLEVNDAMVAAEGLTPGTPKFEKRKAELIAARLDARARPAAPSPNSTGSDH